jgi:hypothetical protein
MNKFDVVLPVGPNEIPIINDVVNLVKTNVKGFNKIYLLTPDETLNIDGCITINENIFPFTKEEITEILGESCRINWVYQQLLKLYAVNVIPDCLDNILILDSDVFILKELNFMDNDKPIFTVGYEYTVEYHEHSKRLHPSLIRANSKYSGVSHHMLFNKNYLKELFDLIENHNDKPFFNVFLESIDNRDKNDFKCSEYEIYFNFMCLYHNDNMIIRELKWGNVPYLTTDVINKYDYASVPKYLGTR